MPLDPNNQQSQVQSSATADTMPQSGGQPVQQVTSSDTNTPTTQQPAQDTQTTSQSPANMPSASAQQQTAPQPKQQSSAMVSNAPAANTSDPTNPSNHPSVQKAGWLYKTAEVLAGGPRYKTTIDVNTGQTTRTQIPLSRADVGLAIAMEAISGAAAGLAQTGPGATGRAVAAGFQQVSQQQQQAQQQQDAQSQQEFQNQVSSIGRKTSIAETNSRTILNTATAEQMGADAIDKLVSINRASGILDVAPEALDNGGEPVTQDDLMSAMKSGKLNVTDSLGPVVGRTEVTNPDGSKRWEALHVVVKDPNTKVPLDQATWDRFSAAGVPGFPKSTSIGSTAMIPLRMLQNANEVAGSHALADARLKDLKGELDGTAYAGQVPSSIDFTKPGVPRAFQTFQRYISHNASNLEDPYTALQEMGADKRDPKTGEMMPNPDAKAVPIVMDALGGPSVLLAAHNQLVANKQNAEKFSVIDSQDKAQAVLAAPKRFSKDQLAAASNFVRISQSESIGKAVAEARAHAIATGADTEAMLKTGVNPITGEKLTLQNAPDSMLVDPNGNVVPQNQQTLYKPTAQQRQTSDTARQVLAISADLQTQVSQNPALIGPLSGNSAKAFAPFGIGTEAAQKMLDNVSLLQSAVTKMHTGRFSSEILKKSGSLIFPGMNNDQFAGAMDSLKAVAGRYANEDQLQTVANFKQQSQQTQQQPSPQAQGASSLTNLQINPQTQQQIGWNGKQWVDVKTRQAVK